MRIEVHSRSGKTLVPGGVHLDDKATVQDLQQAITKSGKGRLHPTRQRLTVPGAAGAKPTVLSSSEQLSDLNLADGSVVTLKDLGLQVGYRTLFFWEYLGPLILYALVYFQPGIFYHHLQHAHHSGVGKLIPYQEAFPEKQNVQTLALAYWSFHFAKRIFETYFVHKFSHATVPVSSLAKNCVYYWAFAVFVAYFINHPLYTAPPLAQTYAAFASAGLCQLANFRCHVIQSGLRPSGGTGYSIPRGFLFEYVTCANYCAEIYGWVAFTVGTQTVAPGIFILCGGAQMAIWAAGKHARLRKIYDGKDGKEKYPRRWVMLPPFY